MNFGETIARGHGVVKQALSLTRKNKILWLYMFAAYSLYMLCTFSGFMCAGHGGVCLLSAVKFFGGYIIAYFVFAALFNKFLAIIKGQQKSIISCFSFEKTILWQIFVLACSFGVLSWLYMATVGTLWQVGVVLVSIPVYAIGLFTLLTVLDQPTPLLDAIKRANRILWRVLGAFMCAFIESYIVFLAIVFTLALVMVSLLWLGYHFALIHAPALATVDQVSKLLEMASSPVAIGILFVGGVTILFCVVFYMVVMSAMSVILYRDANVQLRNEQQGPTLPM